MKEYTAMKVLKLLLRIYVIYLVVLLVQSCHKEEVHIYPVTDIDGNGYDTVAIGPHVWLVQNLRTTLYANGDLIGTTSPSDKDISGESSPKYQWAPYGNENSVSESGRFYTWYVVTDNRGICPTGWHVPSIAEWEALADYLINNNYGFEGSGSDIAKAMAAKSGWDPSIASGVPGNDQATNNSSGFSAVPKGWRDKTNSIGSGQTASYWSVSAFDAADAYLPEIWAHNSEFIGSLLNEKYCGASVRCLKD